MNIKERILTKPGYKIFAFLFLIILTIFIMYKNNEISEIKNNPNIIIMCKIKNKGWVEINKSKIITILDDGTFVFENGYAKNCVVKGL